MAICIRLHSIWQGNWKAATSYESFRVSAR